jgi:hypothetical protein
MTFQPGMCAASNHEIDRISGLSDRIQYRLKTLIWRQETEAKRGQPSGFSISGCDTTPACRGRIDAMGHDNGIR